MRVPRQLTPAPRVLCALALLAPALVLSGLRPSGPAERTLRLRGGDHQRSFTRPSFRRGARSSPRWQPRAAPLYSIEGNTPQYRAAARDVDTAHAEMAKYMRTGDVDAALRLALDGAALHPHDQAMLFAAAALLEMRGRQHEAAAKLEALIALNATHSSALMSLARVVCFKTELNVVKARELASRAIEADPTSAQALSTAAQIEHYGAHDLAAAKAMYRTALQQDANHFPSLTHLGKLLHSEAATGGRDRTRSVSVNERSVSGGDVDTEGGVECDVWEGEGVEGAEQCFRLAMRLVPLDAETLVAYAQLIVDTCRGQIGHPLPDELRARRLEAAGDK